MIHKFEKLISVGKFRDYQANGQVSFNKLTLVYADNGSGKTTLTSVLRSLTLGMPEIVRRRVSTNSTIPQAAQVVQRDAANNETHHTLRAAGWSNPFPNIEIFDIHFVNDNIYSGFDFTEDHKRQLHDFVIGAQGVAIKGQIEQNKNAKAAARVAMDGFINQIVLNVGNGLTVQGMTDFIGLVENQHPNIDARITAAQASLASARASVVIRQLPGVSQINLLASSSVDFTAINSDLQTTPTIIQDSALQAIFEQHCTELSSNSLSNPQNWIKAGLGYIQSKNNSPVLGCPFCKQPVNDTIDIVKAYTLRFNDEFNNLLQRLQRHLLSLQQFNITALVQQINTAIQTNARTLQSWANHLPAVTAPSYTGLPNEQAIKVQIDALIAAIQQKIQNPSVVVPLASSNALEGVFSSISQNTSIYNQSVNTYNGHVDAFKTAIPTEANALHELNTANRIKARFTPEIIALCAQLNTQRIQLHALDTAYPILIQQEKTAAIIFFGLYKSKINYYLRDVFKTPFLIDNVTHIAPQGRATQSKLGYQLTVDGNPISFDAGQLTNAKDCLSEGDKSTLALAFFLAKLDLDPGIADKIVVIDDPLSSFDSNRRLYTVQLIRDLLPKVKQLIILSHNEFFLSEIYKYANRGERKALRIVQNFLTGSSMIEDLDLEKMVEHDYFKHIGELQDFLAHADLARKDLVLGLMRNVLEAHIKFKFYRQVAGLPEHQRTFGNLIDELVRQAVVFRDNPNNATIIAKMRLINGVSCKTHHGEGTPDYAVLGIDPNTINVTELAGLVTDVFDLIDNRL